jgi:hypothetical protein
LCACRGFLFRPRTIIQAMAALSVTCPQSNRMSGGVARTAERVVAATAIFDHANGDYATTTSEGLLGAS